LWKNTLLRGAQGQAAFDKYRTAFTRESQNTQALLTHLSELLPKIGMDNRQVLATRDIHAGLEQKYLTALNDYQVGDVTSAQRVDKQVTGIDREPTKMIDDVVTQTLKHAKTLHQQTIAQNQARYQETRWMLLLAMALTLAAGLLVTWWLIRSITRPLAQAVSIARTVAAGGDACSVG
jgi:methyl-accepting chemotaxis protein